MSASTSSDALPVRTENIKQYVKRYEELHPEPKKAVPVDPSSRWFRKDQRTECIDKCKHELFQAAMEESGMKSSSEIPTETQKIIHARYAAMQSQCSNACSSL